MLMSNPIYPISIPFLLLNLHLQTMNNAGYEKDTLQKLL